MNPDIPNPFRSAIVADPWHWDVVDVAEIHGEAFDLCCRALEHVRSQKMSTSILFYGEAGSGKTHLLARLQAYLAGILTTRGLAPPAVFVSIRLQTSPQMIWRHLRNRLGEDLLRPSNDGSSQLERILLPHISNLSPGIGEPRVWLEQLQSRVRSSPETEEAAAAELDEALDQLDQQLLINDRDLMTVIRHLLLGRQIRDARAWLRGESLPEAALARLAVNTEQEDDVEDRARRIVLSLTRLTGTEIPLVFCFDQVEALQSHPDDLEGLLKFGQMASYLHDNTKNLLIISCILTQFYLKLDQLLISSDRDRLIESGSRLLAPLLPEQAERLVEARLNADPELCKLRGPKPGRFWPLRRSDIREALHKNKYTPRELLSFCAEKFEAALRPEALKSKPPLADFLAHTVAERLEQSAAASAAENTDQILTHGLPLLLRLVDRNWELKATARIGDADLVFENPRGRLNVSLCNQHNMTTLAGRLRRLREQISEEVLEESIHERFILIRDARLPIGSNAIKTREHREQLVAQGFLWISASTAMLAALDTLRGLLSEAKAGDLSNGGETVPSAAVEEWLAANLDLNLGPLRELINHLLPESLAPDRWENDTDFNLSEDIGELLHDHYLVAVADAACKLERDEDEISECARRHTERFGLLKGPPALLFQPTGAHKPRHSDVLSTPAEQLFSDIFASLAGHDASLNFRAAIADAEPDIEEWRRALIRHAYYKLLGPRLQIHQSALQQATDNLLNLWDATQEMCDWLATMLWQHLGTNAPTVQGFESSHAGSVRMQHLGTHASSVRASDYGTVGESPHPGSVRTQANAIWRIPGTKKWFTVRLESGQTATDSDLAHAALYHQLLHAAGQEPQESLSLVTFGPQRRERTFSAAELAAAGVARLSHSFSEMRPQFPKPDPLHGCSKAPLGIDSEGSLRLIDFAQPEDAHLLVAGMAGSGKTEWLRTAIAGLIITNTTATLRLLLIDATGTAFAPFHDSPFLLCPIINPAERSAARILAKLSEEMEWRYRLFGQSERDSLAGYAELNGKGMPRIFCICDEYTDLIAGGNRKAIERELAKLGQRARAAGIHLIFATRHTGRGIIKGALDSTFPARIVMKLRKSGESKVLLDYPGAENLAGRGDLLFKDVGKPVRLQGLIS